MTRPESWHLIESGVGDGTPNLTEDYYGPVVHPDGRRWGVRTYRDTMTVGSGDHPGGVVQVSDAAMLLDAHRREVQYRIVDRLALGVRCEECDDGMVMVGQHTQLAGPAECGDCNGSGYRVPAYRLDWALIQPWNDVTAEQTAEILACSVARVRAGLGPAVAMFSAWVDGPWNGPALRRVAASGDSRHTVGHGGCLAQQKRERKEEDNDSLDAGVALLGADGSLTCPWVTP